MLLLFGAKKKNRKKIRRVQGLISQELLRLFLSNLVCKVLYMKTLKYVDLVEIDARLHKYHTGVPVRISWFRVFLVPWPLIHYRVS